MKKSGLIAGSVLGTILCLTGCGPTTQEVLINYEQNLSAGTVQNSISLVESVEEDEGKDQLLWHLMAGAAYSYSGNTEEGIKRFDKAEDIFAINDKSSVFARGGTGAMLVNDASFNYNGIGQDRIFCCFYKALDYAAQSKPDAARTELNRAMEHQENWLFERRSDIAAADETMEKEAAAKSKENGSAKINENAAADKIIRNSRFIDLIRKNINYDMGFSLDGLTPADYQNAYVTHFTGIFRQLNGDNGRDHLRDAAKLKPDNPILQADFAAVEAGQKFQNDVWIYAEDGLCPKREEVRIDMPLILIPYLNRYVHYAGVAFPKLLARSGGADQYIIQANGVNYQMSELENIDRLILTEYNVYMSAAMKRELIRCLLKVGAQVACGIMAEQTKNDWARAGLIAGQVSAAAYAAATNHADVRSWTALPKRIFMIHIPNPANGEITIQTGTHIQKIVLQKGNHMIWLRKAAPFAPILIKTVSFPAR